MKIRLAGTQDIDLLVILEQKHLNDELASATMGLAGQAFSAAELTQLVCQHWVVVAEVDGNIIGYVIAGRWDFFNTWPIYRHLLRHLGLLQWDGPRLTPTNSCQYGPIWIHQAYRGNGIFELLVNHLKTVVAPNFSYMLTFIAEENERSFAAHTAKANMQVVDFFDYESRGYYLLASKTA
ncbi:MAG: GNAT family N-acetyltransferase [Shewanella sp.]|uniref:GNAT family N-acetyltransferase n=1 Tax=Shewanella sp. TaxID=50422 RepID=UPI003F3BF958